MVVMTAGTQFFYLCLGGRFSARHSELLRPVVRGASRYLRWTCSKWSESWSMNWKRIPQNKQKGSLLPVLTTLAVFASLLHSIYIFFCYFFCIRPPCKSRIHEGKYIRNMRKLAVRFSTFLTQKKSIGLNLHKKSLSEKKSCCWQKYRKTSVACL